jgi:hypothetical protein
MGGQLSARVSIIKVSRRREKIGRGKRQSRKSRKKKRLGVINLPP